MVRDITSSFLVSKLKFFDDGSTYQSIGLTVGDFPCHVTNQLGDEVEHCLPRIQGEDFSGLCALCLIDKDSDQNALSHSVQRKVGLYLRSDFSLHVDGH